ncbi:hypothetical protein V1277_001222 [Bradyrhizobium sp. AZCC 1588]|uniref:hypothetical protein n=1 Tax=unclassified Bradyrhizobium TaxID=2631580 RepID=UPI002FF10169
MKLLWVVEISFYHLQDSRAIVLNFWDENTLATALWRPPVSGWQSPRYAPSGLFNARLAVARKN